MFYLYILTLLEFYIILKLTRNHKYNVQISLISALLFFLYLKKTKYSYNLEGFEDIDGISSGDYIEFKKVNYETNSEYGYLVGKNESVLGGDDKSNNRNSIFKIVKDKEDGVIKNGDTVTLLNEVKNYYLSSNETPSSLIDSGFVVELSKNLSENAKWAIEVEGEGNFTSTSKFRLRHNNSGYYLFITEKFNQENSSLGVVLVSPTYLKNTNKVEKSKFLLERTEKSSNQGLRLYDQYNWEINGLIKYFASRDENADMEQIDFISRKGYNELRSCFVPKGREILFYRGTRQREYFTRLGPGWHNNLSLGKIGSLLYQTNCGAKMYSRSNYKGDMLCLLNGMHNLPFKPRSWRISPEFNVKLFSGNDQVYIADTENVGLREVAQSASLGKKFSDVQEVYVSSKDATDFIGNLNKSPEEKDTHRRYFLPKNPNLPNIKQSNITCVLDATNKDSYSGGRNWLDISGKNNHVVYKDNPSFAYGKVILNKNTTVLPVIQRFGVGESLNGYTVVIFGEFLGETLQKVNKDRLITYVIRRKSNQAGGEVTKLVDGKVVSNNAEQNKVFNLGEEVAPILHNNFIGKVQSFIVYNIGLEDEEINKLSGLLKTNYEQYLSKIDENVEKNIRNRVNDYPISTKGMRCYLDAKYSSGGEIWKDISGNNNNFRFTEESKLLGDKYFKVKRLLGTEANRIGIENGNEGYTVILYSRGRSGNGKVKIGNINLLQNASSKQIKFNHGEQSFEANGGEDMRRMNVTSFRKSSDASSQLSIFMNGRIMNFGPQEAIKTRLDDSQVEIDFTDLDGEIAGLLIYSRGLNNGEIRLVSDWLRRPNYGSNVKLTGEVDKSNWVGDGFCLAVDNFDSTDCISFRDEKTLVNNNGTGFCYTSKDKKKKGYCTSKPKRIDIDDKYNIKSRSWDDSKTYCENRGGRLCSSNELTIGGSGYIPRTGFDSLSARDCLEMGGIYNEEKGYCGTASSEGKDRMILVDNYMWAPVNDRENEWVFVGTKDKSGDEKLEWVGKTYKEIFNKQPEWGLNYQNKEYKRASICCGIKSLSRCDKLKIYQKNYDARINNEQDESLKERLVRRKNQYVEEYNRDCRNETYFDVNKQLNMYKDQYNNIINQLGNTRTDKENLIRNLKELKSYEDSEGNRYLEKVINKYDESGNPVYKTYGKIPDLVRKIVGTRQAIVAEKERQKNCPKDMDCTEVVKVEPKDKVHPLEIEQECTADDLRDALLDSRALDKQSYDDLKNILSTENIMKNLNIKNHRDYYKYVNRDKVRPCSDLGPK